MNMKFYVIAQKKERGCPMGLLNAVLYDHCPEDPSSIEHGLAYPWYSDPHELRQYPEEMCLVTKEKLIDFSIRSISLTQFLDRGFLDSLLDFKASLKDFKAIDVMSHKTKERIVDKEYFASMFAEDFFLEPSEVVDEKLSSIVSASFGLRAIKKISLKGSVDRHVFAINGIDARQSTIFCSEEFVQKARERKTKGIEFVPLDAAKWADVNSFGSDMDVVLPVL